jgi:F-box-like
MSINDIIPAEILSEIFQKSLPRQLDRNGRIAFQTIRSVCPRWRTVSLSSPILWSSVCTSCRLSDQGQDAPDIKCMDEWFSRAGPVLLLELDFTDLSNSGRYSKVTEALEAFIRRYQHRWRFLSLCLNPNCLWDVLFRPPSLNWSNLHTFKLWAYDFMHVDNKRARHGLLELQKMPALRCIIVEDISEYTFQERYGPATVEELRLLLDDFGIKQGRLISSYQNLTTLELILPDESLLPPDDHYHWPTITSFTFNAYSVDLLDHLTLPHLVRLELQLYPIPREGDDRSTILLSFLARSGTKSLKSIRMDSHSDEGFVSQVLPTLATILHLTDIDLDLWPSDQEIYSREEHSKEEWFPNLRNMTISTASEDLVEVECMQSLVVFLRHREDAGLAELKMLTIRRREGAAGFLYEVFNRVNIGKIFVMVPW